MPKGRATTRPSLGSRSGGRPGGPGGWLPGPLVPLAPRSGARVVTGRCYVLRRPAAPPERGRGVGALPYAARRDAGRRGGPGAGAAGAGNRAAGARRARRARRVAGPVALPVAGRGLHDVPAAVPVPGDRPAARAAGPSRGTRHAGPRRSRAAVRPAGGAARIEPEWDRLVAAEPELAGLPSGDGGRARWFAQAREMLARYFTLEDPTRIEPAHRELHVQVVLPSGLRLRGYIDRLDVSAAGDVRIVDYKTGT